ncbi:hypothetical protein [Nocardia transvalensis]|uniref:hypothetical protein n=1 Tax=Nocardia transvalensis TaxID=37333 RepID=UPI0018940209|nr:hypothetical protein [Nocardia transvalensis]MBF6331937.1 hypothetical protein [Nocardia transvalensis]
MIKTATVLAHHTAPTTAERISVSDVLAIKFLEHAPIQLLWRVDHPVDASRLNHLRNNLIDGPLSRKLIPARIPPARPYWTRSTHRYPLILDPNPVPATTVMGWADRQVAAASFDVAAGRGWVLSAADFDDGGSVVSIVASHAITDGQGMLGAVDFAARADLSHAVPDHQRPTLGGDLIDATTAGARECWRTIVPLALPRAQAIRDLFNRSNWY